MPQFSEFLQENQKLLIGLAAGGAAILAGGYLYYRWSSSHDRIPTKWIEIATLNHIVSYPIKSCGPIHLDQIDCTQLGPRVDFLRDRVFMIVTLDGKFTTGRQHPKTVLIQPRFQIDVMTLSAPGKKDIEINVWALQSKETKEAVVWGATVKAIDCGDQVAEWISDFILGTSSGLRLVYYPLDEPTRPLRDQHLGIETMTTEHLGALHDASSYMMLNDASMLDLNGRLEKPVTSIHFRPNFTVTGACAYDEDEWDWVKIGDEAIFKRVKHCTRCIFTTIDPYTGKKDPNEEPLRTLRKFRLLPKVSNVNPVFGIHLGLIKPGKVHFNDTVYVALKE